MMNKKGDVAISTIVIIILALVVLVVVIYGFTVGWGNLFQNILGFGGGKVNVESVVRGCQVACTTQASFDYCTKQRDVFFEEKQKAEKLTCKQLELRNVGLNFCETVDCGADSIAKGTCIPKFERCNVPIKQDCIAIKGCKWLDDPNSEDPNMGSCKQDSSFSCDIYNNNKPLCDRAACEFVPLQN